MNTPAPATRNKNPPKVASFRSRQLELFARFDALREVCIELVECAEPSRRAYLLGKLAIARDSGMPMHAGDKCPEDFDGS